MNGSPQILISRVIRLPLSGETMNPYTLGNMYEINHTVNVTVLIL